ncbi:MAG: hypothetical protein HN580_16375 [Deltaproteobacteria bacterium]|jgi:hypothetical protein|nr:hypothetical protein [Deltaproteobacteria bacterium]MBT4639081.1 hypothetical protein [Deltaproteobacteria bacterium]MBT6613263.1 hypothetical protein [Deltaproteobacteria bacterium]MBT7154670.1 hypothetical protein [Deltaproteobacteria bacterium]MBT7711577.1 hypothetical protein [Deltaproteobacteria bacterium]
MSTETLKDQFKKQNNLMIENCCQAADKFSEATENFTEKFLGAIPNLPEENKLWIRDWNKFNKQGVSNFKQTLNSFSEAPVAEKTPRAFVRASLDSFDKNVNQLFEQVSQAQAQGEKYFDKISEKIPEPGKQWAKQWSKATSSGIEGLKTLVDKNIELANQFVAANADSSSEPVKPESKTKTAAKP